MLNIFSNDTVWIKKCVLSKRKGDVVLGTVSPFFFFVPFKLDFFHWGYLTTGRKKWQYRNMANNMAINLPGDAVTAGIA
jgi:hypothetical protein